MIFAGISIGSGFCSFCVASTDDATVINTYSPEGVASILKRVYPGAYERGEVSFDEYEISDFIFFQRKDKKIAVFSESDCRFVSMHNDDVAFVVETMREKSRVGQSGGPVDNGPYTD